MMMTVVSVLALVTIIAIVAGFVALRRLDRLGSQHFDAFVRECYVSIDAAVEIQTLTRQINVLAGALDNVISNVDEQEDQLRRFAANLPGGVRLLSEDRSAAMRQVHGPIWVAPASGAIS